MANRVAAARCRRLFKWLKTFARLDALLSTSRNGITFQLYAAVVAILMMHVRTGRPVDIYTLSALSAVARGNQTLEQAIEYLGCRAREKALARQRQARKRALKKLV